MPATFQPLQTTTLGSNQSSLTLFSNIPSTYTDLVIVGDFISNTLIFGGLWLRFNGSSATDYSSTTLEGSGSNAITFRESNSNRMQVGYNDANARQMFVINIMDYANTTTNKTALVRYGNPTPLVQARIGMWRSTAAISSITMGVDNQNIASGSTFTLYGVKAG